MAFDAATLAREVAAQGLRLVRYEPGEIVWPGTLTEALATKLAQAYAAGQAASGRCHCQHDPHCAVRASDSATTVPLHDPQ